MNCKNCNNELRPGAMFCPQCGQRQESSGSARPSYETSHAEATRGTACPSCGRFVAYGQDWCSCGWTRERSTAPAPERPRPSWETTPRTAPAAPAYSKSAAPQINIAALVVVCICALLWLVAPFVQIIDYTALEIVTEADPEAVAWQCAAAFGAGILISGICVLCKTNGAQIAAGAAGGFVIARYFIYLSDYVRDFGDYFEALSDTWAWGWVLMMVGMVILSCIGGKKK